MKIAIDTRWIFEELSGVGQVTRQGRGMGVGVEKGASGVGSGDAPAGHRLGNQWVAAHRVAQIRGDLQRFGIDPVGHVSDT